MEKYARQAVSEGVKTPEDLRVGGDSEIYRVLNLHYNRNNHIEVWDPKVRKITTRKYALTLFALLFLLLLFSIWIFFDIFDCFLTDVVFFFGGDFCRFLITLGTSWSKRSRSSSRRSKVARTPSSRGRSRYTRWYRGSTTPCPSTSRAQTSWSSSSERAVRHQLPWWTIASR